ncbi:MAG: GNAT family N-acetyltransferase [Rhodospirillaceae bacterium]|nr:MAG: GNAT family N-acetyltransferase [Rhodospirillaceae bacterium]
MTNIVFRTATQQDLASIINMLADDPLGALREDPSSSAYADTFKIIEADPHNQIIVADQGGDVVACLQLTFIHGLSHTGATRAQIEGVRVASTQRGQGLGQRLFKHAIELAQDRGCTLVQLTTDASRDDAQAFYKKLGFTPSHIGMKLVLKSK